MPHRIPIRPLVAALLAAAGVAAFYLGRPAPAADNVSSATAVTSTPSGTLTAAQSRATLARLRVAPLGPLAGYDRDCGHGHGCTFGPAWSDDVSVAGGHNGCDTRDDVLAAQLANVRYRSGSRCVVESGTLLDPYTGQTVDFTKAHASAVQIDHVVPLAAAYQAGAGNWTSTRRQNFANDPRNLVAVDAHSNEQKGDKTPDQWLPPNVADRCSYARETVTMLSAYGLPITAADKSTLADLLNPCR